MLKLKVSIPHAGPGTLYIDDEHSFNTYFLSWMSFNDSGLFQFWIYLNWENLDWCSLEGNGNKFIIGDLNILLFAFQSKSSTLKCYVHHGLNTANGHKRIRKNVDVDDRVKPNCKTDKTGTENHCYML